MAFVVTKACSDPSRIGMHRIASLGSGLIKPTHNNTHGDKGSSKSNEQCQGHQGATQTDPA